MCFDNRMSVLWLIEVLAGFCFAHGRFFFVVFCLFRPFSLPHSFLCFPPLVHVKLDVYYCGVCK
jgi:hypothetical protein